jgi:hypothetical protein
MAKEKRGGRVYEKGESLLMQNADQDEKGSKLFS